MTDNKTNNYPKVSIITVTFNSETTLRDTVESVIKQEYANIEYIIVDGVSKDNTIEIIKEYALLYPIKWISEADNGLYDAMNKGIQMATGDIIGIINSDDFYVDEKVIGEIVNAFSGVDVEAVYGDLLYVDAAITDKIVRKWRSGQYKENAFLYGWMPPHPTFFVRRELYDRFGKFNTQLRSAADYELMLRLIHKNKINIVYIARYLVKMRAGGVSNGSLKNRLKGNQEDKKAWELNHLKPYFFTMIFKPLRKINQFIRR